MYSLNEVMQLEITILPSKARVSLMKFQNQAWKIFELFVRKSKSLPQTMRLLPLILVPPRL